MGVAMLDLGPAGELGRRRRSLRFYNARIYPAQQPPPRARFTARVAEELLGFEVADGRARIVYPSGLTSRARLGEWSHEVKTDLRVVARAGTYVVEVRPLSCNRHVDCAVADERARAEGRDHAVHCRTEDCEDCFGT